MQWSADIDKLHRIDGQSWERIREVIDWSQRDDFWHRNILSGSKLRKQFDRLGAAMKQTVKPRKPGILSIAEQRERARKLEEEGL
jgi:hypothetical protein